MNGNPIHRDPETMAEGLGSRGFALGRNESSLRLIGREGIPLRERSDENLMLEHGQGSESAFAELVRRHQKGVLNYTFRMVQNRHIAEELTQEVFVALVKNAQRYEPVAKFTTYLYAIASNIVSKEWLRQKRRPRLFSLTSMWGGAKEAEEEVDLLDHAADGRSDVAAAFERQEISEAVNLALRRLPEHQREAFVLRRFQDLPYEEIADITKSPVGTVKSRVVRAERALRPLLESFREYA
ncbi:MAG: sigma-70 family RNA polymerase sigma factor [Candidatus Hydrogenedentes bacterium]|nr:sigma-70 family RNA polymerase sigma factor [Candidatus Hydrogenedentota bacterium]